MQNSEFHQLNTEFFKRIDSEGFRKLAKKKSTWIRQGANGVSAELCIRQDKYGWVPQYGSSMMYDLMPHYEGRPVNYYPAKQLRLFELKEYGTDIIKDATLILNTFASKIPQYAGSEDDSQYDFLKSPWTKEKVINNIGDWYYFYDQEDLLAWHNALYPALIKAADKVQKQFENENFQKISKNKGGFLKATIDPETGEIEIIE